MLKRKRVSRPRAVRLRVPEGAGLAVDYSTIRLERRIADMVRVVARVERKGKNLTSLVEQMLRVYCETKHPDFEFVADGPENKPRGGA